MGSFLKRVVSWMMIIAISHSHIVPPSAWAALSVDQEGGVGNLSGHSPLMSSGGHKEYAEGGGETAHPPLYAAPLGGDAQLL